MAMEVWISLAALIFMEIILGIDNIVFIAVLVQALPENQRDKARILGLSLALITRIMLLFAISWLMKLTTPLFTLLGHGFTGRDLILLGGGLFLLGKSSHEIFKEMEVSEQEKSMAEKAASFGWVIFQILIIDLVFSLDSVITAVGMVDELWMMVTAVVIAIGVMLAFSGSISAFINRHPSVKILALSFLILIGVLLVAEGMGQHINRGYIYFAMFFSLSVELINLRLRGKKKIRP